MVTDDTGLAADARRSGSRVVLGGVIAIVLILTLTAVFLFLTLPDGNAFNARVERIFVENDALTAEAEIKLLEILALSGTAFSETLTSYRIVIFVLLVFATALLIAAGGVVGGLNTTYAAFASRVREIGTLRTLGYSRVAIVNTLVEESVLTSSIGGVLAAIIAWSLLDGLTIEFSLGAFGLSVGPQEIAIGLGVGFLLGIVGALIPAVRCLRLPVPEALRAPA